MRLSTKDQLLAMLEADSEPPSPVPICIICMETAEAPTTTRCKHTFCLHELLGWLEKRCTCPICRTKLYREPTSRSIGNNLPQNAAADFRITHQPVTGMQVGLMAFGGNDASDEILQILNTYIIHGCIGPDYHARTYVAFNQGFMNHKTAAMIWVRPSQTAYGNLCPHEWHLVSESINQTILRLDRRTPTALELFLTLKSDARNALRNQFPDYGVHVGTPNRRRTFEDDMLELIQAVTRYAQVMYDNKAQRGDFDCQEVEGPASS